MGTIFPDVEKALVAFLKPLLSGVTVATVKPAAGTSPYPGKVVTVRADGGSQLERGITRSELVGVNVYATSYADASDLARLVEAHVRNAAGVGGIKRVETELSPTRVVDPSTDSSHQRYMTFSVVTKATDF